MKLAITLIVFALVLKFAPSLAEYVYRVASLPREIAAIQHIAQTREQAIEAAIKGSQ